MAITPLEQYGTIGRTQDFSTIKQQEENKMLGSQTIIQSQVEKNAENRLSQVRQADNSEMLDKKFDAKEKGDNQYAGDGGRGRKKAPAKQTDGKVILKGAGSFDMKI